jgi:hypothetical protein
MAKKPAAKSATETQRRRVGKQTANAGSQKSDSLCASVPLWQKPSALLDTRVVYCGDNLEHLAKLPDGPSRTGQCWGETKEKRAFADRLESTRAYIDCMRPRCVQLARVLKKTGSFYYHCDWHASHYVKVMLDQILGENNFSR